MKGNPYPGLKATKEHVEKKKTKQNLAIQIGEKMGTV